MIFSRLHNFIFIKGRKLAGTSFEVALSRICGPGDIITPITPVDEKVRISLGYRHAQNYGCDPEALSKYIEHLKLSDASITADLSAPKGIFSNHTSLAEAHELIGEEIIRARVVAISRSPYQTVLSRLNHMSKFKQYKNTGNTMKASSEEMRKNLQKLLKLIRSNKAERNIDLYKQPESPNDIEITFLRFERLEQDLSQWLRSLNIEDEISLPHLKRGQNLADEAILEIATTNELKEINEYYDDEFARFGYDKLVR